STTAPFCRSCDRSRLTADGLWYLCLYAARGMDLRGPLRAGATPEELAELIASAWRRRDDRGAEQRLQLANRSALLPTAELERAHLTWVPTGGGVARPPPGYFPIPPRVLPRGPFSRTAPPGPGALILSKAATPAAATAVSASISTPVFPVIRALAVTTARPP